MLFLTKIAVMLCLVTGNIYAGANPFSIILKNREQNIEGELNNMLTITIRAIGSTTLEEEPFYFKVYFGGDSLEILEGKSVYKGMLKGLSEKSFQILLRAVQPGSGQIRVKVYSYLTESQIDVSGSRLFYSNYRVMENEDPENPRLLVNLEDVQEKLSQTVIGEADQETQAAARAEGTVQEGEGGDGEVAPENAQKETDQIANAFVINAKYRQNKMLRYFLLLVSFFILVYLYVRLRKR
ncbi:MAG: hypothetical protein JXA66_07690 [Oligoflexia bacterium]|nr:hypothetical protein [Oligoflexia bacterium]